MGLRPGGECAYAGTSDKPRPTTVAQANTMHKACTIERRRWCRISLLFEDMAIRLSRQTSRSECPLSERPGSTL